MTNRKYLADAHTTFDKALAEFNASGLTSFDEWLNKERIEWEFKAGDFLEHVNDKNSLCLVVGFSEDNMFVKCIMRNGEFEVADAAYIHIGNIPEEFQKDDIFYVPHFYQYLYKKIF